MMERAGKFIYTHLEMSAACLLILFLIAVTRVWNIKIVSGASMEPSFYSGDIILTTKTAPREELLRERVVIAAIRDEDTGKSFYAIKRIKGVPGDTVLIWKGSLYINGKKDETAGNIEDAGIAAETIRLSDDEYFLLGDNTGQSADSRMFGPVKESDIKGIFIRKIP